MKNKQRYISISLFILSTIFTLVGIVFIQDELSLASSEQNIDVIRNSYISTGFKTIIFLILQSIICGVLWLTVRQHKFDKLIDNELLDTDISSSPFTDTEKHLTVKETISQIVDDSKQVLEKIEKIDSTLLSRHEVANKVLEAIANHFEITQGIIYTANNETQTLHFLAGYAYFKKESETYEYGEGLAGQVAKAQQIVNIQSIPAGYIKTVSGLGESVPSNLLIVPILQSSLTIAIIELASFIEFNKEAENQFKLIGKSISKKLQNAKK